MNYMGDKEYWNDKFTKRSDKPLMPEKSLVDNINYFKKGTVLDVACGDGRNTLFLLDNKFEVTGIDFSNKALERLRMFANNNNYSVKTEQVDLSETEALNDIGIFDNIVINHYRLNEKQLINLEEHLSEKGILFICGFGHNHKVDSKIRKGDLIQLSDFEGMKQSFEMIKYDEKVDERGFFVTYIFRKK